MWWSSEVVVEARDEEEAKQKGIFHKVKPSLDRIEVREEKE